MRTLARSNQMRHSFLLESLEPRQMLTAVVVNTTLDGNPAGLVSLRDAITIANNSATPTTISFSPTAFATAKTITLNGTQFELSNTKHSTTITGPAAGVTISGNNASRVFLIDSLVSVSMSGLTISKGLVNAGTITGDGGGGIENSGTLSLNNVTISGNNSNALGAGIRNLHSLTATNTTFSGNITGYVGGAIYSSGWPAVVGTATLKLTNVTIVGNTSGHGAGAAIFNDDYNGGSAVTLSNVTIANNTDGANGVGAVYNTPPVRGSTPFNVSNTIIANNIQTGGNANVSGTFISHGHNLIGETDGSTGWTSADLKGIVAVPLSAKLGALAGNGGPTQTLLPSIGSPAINHGSNALIPAGVTTDQRGLKRIIDNVVDIGAVEMGASITVTPAASQSASVNVAKSFALGSFVQSNAVGPFKVTINWGDGSAATILSLSAAGTIPATAHTYKNAGTDTVSISITDAGGNVSNVATYKVTIAGSGSISGRVFNDANADGKAEIGELGLGLWQVYIDVGNKGTFQSTDPNVLTDINGNWTFNGLSAGTFVIRVVQVAGTKTTAPSGGILTVTLASGQVVTGKLFGEN